MVTVIAAGLLVVGFGPARAVDVAAESGCTGVVVEIAERDGVPVAAASAVGCGDDAGRLLPRAVALDRITSAVWRAELPRFDRVDAYVYRSAETEPFVRASATSRWRSELEGRWGARPVTLGLEGVRRGPTGPWFLLPLAALLVLGAAVRAVRSGTVAVVWVRAR